MFQRTPRLATALAAALCVATSAAAQTPAITSPKQHFGFSIGDDYHLATYDQFQAYWQKLDKESSRMQVVEIGKTEEGRPHLAAIITAPENFKQLDRYKQISQQLHRARGMTEQQARALAKEGKSVVWFDGGLHATEVVGAASADRDHVSAGQPQRRRDQSHPARRDHHCRARQPRRHADGLEVLHAECGSDGAPHLQPSPLREVRRATTTTATSTCRIQASPRT